jgi:two-component system, sensor histidine kinase PdtaS
VKNNLQTVAALLRLQARRIDVPEAKQALDEAVRRVRSIALVHETLSQAFDELVDFDDVADRLRLMVTDVGSGATPVATVREGSFGPLPAELATPLAMVLTELLQNAVEHGYPGTPAAAPATRDGRIVMGARREAGRLRVLVDDDGRGLPDGFDARGSMSLGLSIVRTLVESELAGRFDIGAGPVRGTRVVVDVPVPPH